MFSLILLLLNFAEGSLDRSRIPNGLIRRANFAVERTNIPLNIRYSDEVSTDNNLVSDPYDEDFCYDELYRKRTLKLIKEIPFIGLFKNLKNQTKFEASGTVIAKDAAWVVFDNLRTIGRVDLRFSFRGDENILIEEKGESEEASQFEGLAYSASSDTFIVVRETFEKDGLLISRTEEIKFTKDASSYSVVRECMIQFEFEDVNKGFEGIYYFERNGKRYFMGLCESNFCKSIGAGPDSPGLDRGNGRVVLAEMIQEDKHTNCSWEVIKVINVPSKARFLDYSAMAFLGYMGSTVAITSQEDAAVWLGEFDWDTMEFVGKGRVLHFPRNDHCQKVYCNVEGIQFIDASRVVLTSDKSKITQPHNCMHKDQSISIMALPKYE